MVLCTLKYVKKIDLMLSVPTKEKKENTRKCLEVMNMFSALVVVMISQIYAYIQNHQDVFTKCVQFFVSNFNKAKNDNNKGCESSMVNQILVFYDH